MSNTISYNGIEHKATGERVIRRMMAAIIHRGPDEGGILIASPVAVGSVRARREYNPARARTQPGSVQT
jgi:asparagine synthetase B (glutamine-hydrolysing)